MPTRRKPSALLALGVYAGTIAAVVTVPVTLPVLVRLVYAEVESDEANAYAQTARVGLALERGEDPRSSWHDLRIVQRDGTVITKGHLITPEMFALACGTARPASRISLDDNPILASCWRGTDLTVVATWTPKPRSYIGIGVFVMFTALIAGLVNALGMMQLIRPMSQISAALDRVAMGNRNIVMSHTGFAEIDHLIDRLNATAQAVESREHEILARVHVIQEMARLVAHEVRNPLQSLTLLTQLLVDAPDRSERTQLQHEVQNEIHVLDDVVHRLLREGTTRGALRLKLEPIEIHTELQKLQQVRSREAKERGVTVTAHVQTPLVAHLDRMLFMRSVHNLVSNALRAVPDAEGLVEVTASIEGPDLVVRVDDNGPGVDPNLGDRVFELNVTGGEGTGLGLSLTRGVAEAHGGTVCFRPSKLGGAQFEIRVPRHASPPESD